MSTNVSIDRMAQLDIVVRIRKRVMFRMWLFTLCMRAAQWVYPGQCNVTIQHEDEQE